MKNYTKEELHEALGAISSTIAKIEKVREKATLGASQRTLIGRRLSALQIASDLIEREIREQRSVSSQDQNGCYICSMNEKA